MKTLWTILCLTTSALLVAGCASSSFLEQQTQSPRPTFGEEPIAVAPTPLEAGFAGAEPLGLSAPPVFVDVQGTWAFITPPTVTRIERRNGEIDQYTLYEGRPQTTATPFLVITVGPNRRSSAQADPEMYNIADHREYVMNGGIVQEWTGRTSTGAGFSELIIRKPGPQGLAGDICHAMAIVTSDEQQRLALSILASIVFNASPGAGDGQ